MWKRLAALLAFLPVLSLAHIGNPDVYFEGQSGPYRVFVTVRPPVVIPGVAEIEVRTPQSRVAAIEAVPVPLDAAEAKLAPVPDKLKASAQDPQFFTGSLWIMAAGSWQVRVTVDGAAGRATIGVPVPSVALTTKRMQWGLGTVLFVLMVLLFAGVVLLAGASVREAKLDPGAVPDAALISRARRSMVFTFVIVAGLLTLGWWWWRSSEEQYRRNVFSPLPMQAHLNPSGLLSLSIADPAGAALGAARFQPAFFARSADDLVPDHQHLMHLYAIRQPGLDVVYHLHPELTAPGAFRLSLPKMETGNYRLYADIVHANGFPETLTAAITIPDGLPARPLSGDDAAGEAPSWDHAPLDNNRFHLPDGYTMVFEPPSAALRPKELHLLRFVLLDSSGKTPFDMRLYMGMPGHAAFVKTDGTAFAHVHPSGTVAMASLMMAQDQLPSSGVAMNHTHMHHDTVASAPNDVAFPYGFPASGRYRIFVQMKHGEIVETGTFDVNVD